MNINYRKKNKNGNYCKNWNIDDIHEKRHSDASFSRLYVHLLKYSYWPLILQCSVCGSGTVVLFQRLVFCLQQLRRLIHFLFHKRSHNLREKLQESRGTYDEILNITSDSLNTGNIFTVVYPSKWYSYETCTDIPAGIQACFSPCLSTVGIWLHPTGKRVSLRLLT